MVRCLASSLLLAVALLLMAPRAAEAQVNCDAISGAPVVYMQVGDTQEPLVKALGRKLRDSATSPITLVYKTAGSCVNIEAIRNQTAISTNALYVPSSVEDENWTPSMPSVQCLIPAPVQLDIANSALFNSACTTVALPPAVSVIQGPVQAYVMVVPELSTQNAITALEAFFVFGFGAAGMVDPWNNEALMFIRTVTKSTLLAWAANIDVLGMKWKGVQLDKSSEVVSSVANSTNPGQTIGILGAEVYDKNRDKLNSLAYAAYDQYYAYYPDSTATSFDKKNLRDGHYTVWSPTIWMHRGNANAIKVIDLILGKEISPPAGFDSLEVVMAQGLVPDCAMRVNRTVEGGRLSRYTPPESCTCKFESIVDSSTCATCNESTPCAAGVCRRGFCEVN